MVNPENADEICQDMVAMLEFVHNTKLKTTHDDSALPTILFGHSLGAHTVGRTVFLNPHVVQKYCVTGLVLTGTMRENSALGLDSRHMDIQVLA